MTDPFYALIGAAVVLGFIAAVVFYLAYRLYGWDVRVWYYAHLADYTANWYDRREGKGESTPAWRRAFERHAPKRKD